MEQLKRYRPELTVAFQQAIIEGPSLDEISAARAAAEARYQSRAKFPLEEFRIVGVSRQVLAGFRRVPPRDYIEDQLRRFAIGYRSNAVAGLGIVGDTESRRLLSRIASNSADPLAPAAREALRQPRPE